MKLIITLISCLSSLFNKKNLKLNLSCQIFFFFFFVSSLKIALLQVGVMVRDVYVPVTFVILFSNVQPRLHDPIVVYNCRLFDVNRFDS